MKNKDYCVSIAIAALISQQIEDICFNKNRRLVKGTDGCDRKEVKEYNCVALLPQPFIWVR